MTRKIGSKSEISKKSTGQQAASKKDKEFNKAVSEKKNEIRKTFEQLIDSFLLDPDIKKSLTPEEKLALNETLSGNIQQLSRHEIKHSIKEAKTLLKAIYQRLGNELPNFVDDFSHRLKQSLADLKEIEQEKTTYKATANFPVEREVPVEREIPMEKVQLKREKEIENRINLSQLSQEEEIQLIIQDIGKNLRAILKKAEKNTDFIQTLQSFGLNFANNLDSLRRMIGINFAELDTKNVVDSAYEAINLIQSGYKNFIPKDILRIYDKIMLDLERLKDLMLTRR